MKKMNVFFPIIFLIFSGCAMAPKDYDSFSARESEFVKTDLSISEKGLTQEQIRTILSTKFPPQRTVSVAVVFLSGFNTRSINNRGLAFYIMNQGKNINNIEKFVPIPRIFIPKALTFDIIQDLGIRSLCEYTLIFYSNSYRSMNFAQWIKGEFKFESDMEFLLIDNQTTAIIASDRLYSSIIKERTYLSDNDIEEAENEIYTLQAKLLAEKMNVLFVK
jgi:hypothetical protein